MQSWEDREHLREELLLKEEVVPGLKVAHKAFIVGG